MRNRKSLEAEIVYYKPLGYTDTEIIFTDNGEFNTSLYLIYNVINIGEYFVLDMSSERGFSIIAKRGCKPVIISGSVTNIRKTLFSLKVETKLNSAAPVWFILNKNLTTKKIAYLYNTYLCRDISMTIQFVDWNYILNIKKMLLGGKEDTYDNCDLAGVSEYSFEYIDNIYLSKSYTK